MFCKIGVYKISQNLQQKTCARGLQLYLKKRQDFEFCETLRTPFFKDFFLGLTKLNPKPVAGMYSMKKLFLEILQNSQVIICARASFLIKLQPLGLLIVLLNSIVHAVLY